MQNNDHHKDNEHHEDDHDDEKKQNKTKKPKKPANYVLFCTVMSRSYGSVHATKKESHAALIQRIANSLTHLLLIINFFLLG